MNRTRTFALLAMLVALAALVAGCGGGSGDPKAVVEEATLDGLESGRLDATMTISSKGKKGGDVEFTLSGPFQTGAKGNLPQLAMELSVKGEADGEPVDFEGGLTLLSDRAFVGLEGTEYEVDPTTFGFIKSGFERASQEGPEEKGGATKGCQEAAGEIDLEKLVENVESEGSVDVEGTSTTKVSGDIDAGAAVDAVIGLVESPACSSQIEAAGAGLGLSELKEVKGEIASAVKKSHVDLYVGDDHIIRKLAAELTIQPKGSDESVDLSLEMTLSEVNEDQKIEAPKGAKPLEDLFGQLGINPLELLEGGSGGLNGLLEAIGGGNLGGLGGLGGESSGGGGESSSGGGLGGVQQEYVECLQGAETPADLQKCASLLK